jgi:hypothetical protein
MSPFSLRALPVLGAFVLLQPIAGANPVGAQQAALRTITHEDVFLAKRLDAPALSPDGRWVVVSVTEPAYAASERASHLWLVPSDGSAPPRVWATDVSPWAPPAWEAGATS